MYTMSKNRIINQMILDTYPSTSASSQLIQTHTYMTFKRFRQMYVAKNSKQTHSNHFCACIFVWPIFITYSLKVENHFVSCSLFCSVIIGLCVCFLLHHVWFSLFRFLLVFCFCMCVLMFYSFELIPSVSMFYSLNKFYLPFSLHLQLFLF